MAPRNNNLALPYWMDQSTSNSGSLKKLLIRASETYLPVSMNRQRNDCTRYEGVFRLKKTVASTQPIGRTGEAGEEPAM